MDENSAIQAVVSAISDNQSTLLSGLEQNSAPKELKYLSETPLNTPTGYYAVKVFCTAKRELGDSLTGNTNSTTELYLTMYEIFIGVADFARPDPHADGGYPGRTAHRNFRTFVDRLVKLFRRDQKWFPSVSDSPRFRLPEDRQFGREVRVQNYEPIPTETFPLLGAEIRFSLVGCNDGL